MNALQIVLVCLLVILGIAFTIVLYIKFNESTTKKLFVNNKTKRQVENALVSYEDIETIWNHIWTFYYNHGIIKYNKIDAVLTRIINETQNEEVRLKAIYILREKVHSHLYLDDSIAEAIDDFQKLINSSSHYDLKEAGNNLIKEVQRTCQKTQNSQKYDTIIQWLFNAIEIVGLVLAIITL